MRQVPLSNVNKYGHWTMALAAFQTAYVSIVHQLLKWDFNHAKEKISLQFLYRIARSQEKGIVCARITCFNWRSPKPSNAWEGETALDEEPRILSISLQTNLKESFKTSLEESFKESWNEKETMLVNTLRCQPCSKWNVTASSAWKIKTIHEKIWLRNTSLLFNWVNCRHNKTKLG